MINNTLFLYSLLIFLIILLLTLTFGDILFGQRRFLFKTLGKDIRKNKFNDKSLDDLMDTVFIISNMPSARNWTKIRFLYLILANQLVNAGDNLLQVANLQIERFVALSLIQFSEDINSTDERNYSRLSFIAVLLRDLVNAIKSEELTDTYQIISIMNNVINLPSIDNLKEIVELPTRTPNLYREFKKDFETVLAVDKEKYTHFSDFTEKWRASTLYDDTNLFLLVRILELFKRSLGILWTSAVKDIYSISNLDKLVTRYIKALMNNDRISQYQILCEVITELQFFTVVNIDFTFIIEDNRARIAEKETAICDQRYVIKQESDLLLSKFNQIKSFSTQSVL